MQGDLCIIFRVVKLFDLSQIMLANYCCMSYFSGGSSHHIVLLSFQSWCKPVGSPCVAGVDQCCERQGQHCIAPNPLTPQITVCAQTATVSVNDNDNRYRNSNRGRSKSWLFKVHTCVQKSTWRYAIGAIVPILDDRLKKNSWNPERVSSIFTVCLIVCL